MRLHNDTCNYQAYDNHMITVIVGCDY